MFTLFVIGIFCLLFGVAFATIAVREHIHSNEWTGFAHLKYEFRNLMISLATGFIAAGIVILIYFPL